MLLARFAFSPSRPLHRLGRPALASLTPFSTPYASTTSTTYAMLWSGTAGSFIDLESVPPPTFTYSVADSISGDTVYGLARGGSGNGYAVEWTGAVPEPASLSLLAIASPRLLRRRKGKR